MIRGTSAIAARAVVLLAVVATWEMLPRAGLVDPDLLPAFSDVARTVPVLLAARPADRGD